MYRNPGQRLRTLAALVAALLFILPGFGQATTGATSPSDPLAAWPPAAWTDGDVAALTLEEMAFLLAGVRPGTPAASELLAQLDDLHQKDPAYLTTATLGLQGMLQALWHQEQALAGLTPSQRAAWLAAQGGEDIDVAHLVPLLDQGHVRSALAALMETQQAVAALDLQSRLEVDQQMATLEGRLSQAQAHGAPATVRALPPADLDALASTILAQASTDLIPDLAAARQELKAELSSGPAEGLAALQHILAALPSESGALAAVDADGADALVEGVVDAAREVEPILAIWNAQAMAARYMAASQPPNVGLPDPNGPTPLLFANQAPTLHGRTPGATSLEDAIVGFATYVGLDANLDALRADARQAQASMDPLAARLIADVLRAVQNDMQAQAHFATLPVPAAVQSDPAIIQEWSQLLSNGELLAAGSHASEQLLDAVPWMAASVDVVENRNTLMISSMGLIEGLPRLFRESDYNCETSPKEFPGILNLDLCGENDTWENQAVLTIDLGGDDTYLHRAGAPFSTPADPDEGLNGPNLISPTDVVLPTTLLFDLGGSDTYDAGTQECAQGAACVNHPLATNASNSHIGVAPLSVLVDFADDHTDTTNTFIAGSYSQGSAPGLDVNSAVGGDATSTSLNTSAVRALAPVGLLIEQVGEGATVASSYQVLDDDQKPGHSSQGHGEALGRGALIRLVGDGARSEASFEAGDGSQGHYNASHDFSLGAETIAPMGVLLNLGGDGVEHHDQYTAGRESMGFAFVFLDDEAQAWLVDLVGSSSQSDDQFDAGEASRGVGTGGALSLGIAEASRYIALFLDGVLPPQPDNAATVSGTSANARLAHGGDSSDDTHVGSPLGFGSNLGYFVDLGGDDHYVEESEDGPGNNRTWGETSQAVFVSQVGEVESNRTGGFDIASDDRDGDLLPAALETLWADTIAAWNSDPNDSRSTALPAPAAFYINWGEEAHLLDEPYAFVLSAAGSQTYGTGFESTLLFDLGGADAYLGRTAAAAGPTGGLQAGVANHVDEAVTEIDDANNVGTTFTMGRKATTAPSGPAIVSHLLALHLDRDGNDLYATPHAGTQGYASGGAFALHLDMAGSDTYSAPSAAQGVGVTGGIGALVDLGVPYHVGGAEVNAFQAAPMAQGQGHLGGFGVFVATGAHNQASDGRPGYGATAPPLGSFEALPNEARTFTPDAKGDPDEGAISVPFVCSSGSCTAEEVAVESIYYDEVAALFASTTGRRAPRGTSDAGDDVHIGYVSGYSLNMGKNTPPSFSDVRPPANPLQAGRTYQWGIRAVDPEGDPLRACLTIDGDETGLWQDTQCIDLNAGRGLFATRFDHVPTDSKTGKDQVGFPFSLVLTDPGGKPVEYQSSRPEGAVFLVRNAPPEILGTVRGPAVATLSDGEAKAAFQVPFKVTPATRNAQTQADWGLGPVLYDVDGVDWLESTWDGRLRLPFAPRPDGRSVAVCSDFAAPPANVLDGDPTTAALFEWDQACPAVAMTAFPPGPRMVDHVEVRAYIPAVSDPVQLSVEAVDDAGQTTVLGTMAVTSRDAAAPDIGTFDAGLRTLGAIQVRQILQPGQAHNAGNGLFLQQLSAYGPGATGSWTGPGEFAFDLAVVNDYGGKATASVVGFRVTGDPEPERFTLDTVGPRGPAREATLAAGQTYKIAVRANHTDLGGVVCLDFGDGKQACQTSIRKSSRYVFEHAWPVSATPYEVHLVSQPSAGAPSRTLLTKVHAEDAFELKTGSDSIMFLALGATRSTWLSGTTAHLIVDAGGDDFYGGPVAVSRRPAVANTPVDDDLPMARPALAIDLAGDDVYLADEMGAQAFGAFGTVALLADLGGDDIYVAKGLAQGAAVAGGIGLLLDAQGNDAYNPVDSDSAVAAAADASRGFPSLSLQDAVAALPRAALQPSSAWGVQGVGIDGVGMLMDLGGDDFLRAGQVSQGVGGHAESRITPYFFPGEACANRILFGPNIGSVLDDARCAVGVPSGPGEPPRGTEAVFDIVGVPDPAPLIDFLAEQQYYGAGLGVLMTDGSATMDAHALSQGASAPNGRGLLLDTAGGSTLRATALAQAFGYGGAASVALAGPSLAVVGLAGHGDSVTAEGPEGPGVGVAALLAHEDSLVRCRVSCGSPVDLSAAALDAGRDAPSFAISLPDTMDRDSDFVNVSFSGGSVGDAREVRVVTVPLEPRSSGASCRNVPIGPATTIFAGSVPPGVSHQLVVLDASERPDGPVHPAGCLQVAVFVRTGSGEDASAWGARFGTVPVIRAPTVVLDAPVDIDENGFLLDLAIRDPLVAYMEPTVTLRVSGPGGVSALPVSGWVLEDGVAKTTVQWNPGSGRAPGAYTLSATTAWPFTDATLQSSHEHQVTVLDVDQAPPVVALEYVPAQWRAQVPLPVSGVATDSAPITSVQARLLDAATGEVIKVMQGALQVDALEATLKTSTGQQQARWDVGLLPNVQFPGGYVVVQARGQDATKSLGAWTTLGTVLLDYDAPRIVSFASAAGLQGSAASFPIRLQATLEDHSVQACSLPVCPPGSGVRPDTVVGLIRHPDGTLQSLDLVTRQAADGKLVLDLTWRGSGAPASGRYEVILTASDGVENVLSKNPGFSFAIDRDAPDIFTYAVTGPRSGPLVLRPGDAVSVAVEVSDQLAGLAQVALDFGAPAYASCPLDLTQVGKKTGTWVVPGEGALDPACVAGSGPLPHGDVPLVMRAVDKAGNVATSVVNSTIYQHTIDVQGLQTALRKTNGLTFQWATDRPLAAEGTRVWLSSVSDPAATWDARLQGSPGAYVAKFTGLEPETNYLLHLDLKDASGWILNQTLQATTLPPISIASTVSAPDALAWSGVVPISGNVAIASGESYVVTIKADDQRLIERRLTVGRPDSLSGGQGILAFDGQEFIFKWNTTRTFPGVWDGNLTVDLETATPLEPVHFPRRVDNLAPAVDVLLDGTTNGLGWYADTTVVRLNSLDDTGPVTTQVKVDDGPWLLDDAVTLSQDGAYQVQIRVLDGAEPPNVRHIQQSVRIDRSVPVIEVTVPGSGATAQNSLAVEIQAHDGLGSGVLDYRVGNDAGWSSWSTEAPAHVTIDQSKPGEQWVHMEARDVAGNIARRSVSVVYDTAPPEITMGRWVGWDEFARPLLQVVARDLVDGGGLPAGVAEVRFKTMEGAWTTWFDNNGRQVIPVPLGHYGDDGVVFQVRDAAGNVGEPFRFAATPPAPTGIDGAAAATLPAQELLADRLMAPKVVNVTDPVLFAVSVLPLEGDAPDKVWVELNGRRIPLWPAAQNFSDGRLRYQADLLLAPSTLLDPYQHRFIASFDGHEVATPMADGPMVLARATAQPDALDKGAPAPALSALFVLLAMLVGALRRREDHP